MPIELRDYQTEAINKFYEARQKGEHNRFLLTMATGAGKTLVASFMMRDEARSGGRTLFIVHREELIDQTVKKLRRVDESVRIGVVKAERDEWQDVDVVVASVQTISGKKRMPRYPRDHFSLVIVDECHRSAAATYQEVLQHFKVFDEETPVPLLGITATPTRTSGASLDTIFQSHIFHVGLVELIQKNMLVPIKYLTIKTNADLSRVKKSMGDFSERELAHVLNTRNRNDLISRAIKQYASDRKSLVFFCVDIKHSEDLAIALQEHGIAAEAVHGKLSEAERKRRLREFDEGKLRALTSCQLIQEGWDCVRVDCVIFAMQTMSPIRYSQSLGRGTRLSPETGKVDLLVIDCADNAGRHAASLQSVPRLFGLNAAGEHALKSGQDIIAAVKVDEDVKRQEDERIQREAERKRKDAEFLGSQLHARVVDLFAAEAVVPKDLERSKFAWLAVNEDRYLSPLFHNVQMQIYRAEGEDTWRAALLDDNNYRIVKLVGVGSLEDAIDAAEAHLRRNFKYMLQQYKKMAKELPTEKQLKYIGYAGASRPGSKFAAWKTIALSKARDHFLKKAA